MSSLSGKIVCVTGVFQEYTRKQLEKVLAEKGATVKTSVSKKVNLLVAGTNAGSKLTKARERGIEVWNEAQTLAAIADTQASAHSSASPTSASTKRSKSGMDETDDSIVSDISAMKVSELKVALRERGLSTAGRKQELVNRLQSMKDACFKEGLDAMSKLNELIETNDLKLRSAGDSQWTATFLEKKPETEVTNALLKAISDGMAAHCSATTAPMEVGLSKLVLSFCFDNRVPTILNSFKHSPHSCDSHVSDVLNGDTDNPMLLSCAPLLWHWLSLDGLFHVSLDNEFSAIGDEDTDATKNWVPRQNIEELLSCGEEYYPEKVAPVKELKQVLREYVRSADAQLYVYWMPDLEGGMELEDVLCDIAERDYGADVTDAETVSAEHKDNFWLEFCHTTVIVAETQKAMLLLHAWSMEG